MFYVFWFVFATQALFASDNSLVVVYGSSCAGKSSLTKAVTKALGDPWVSIDIDDVVEREKERAIVAAADIDEMADQLFCVEVQQAHASGHKVVADVHSPEHILDVFAGYNPVLVYVYAPLAAIVERDVKRTHAFSRSAKRQLWARGWVYNSYANLLTLSPEGAYGAIDVLSQEDLPGDLFSVHLHEHAQGVFEQVRGVDAPVQLFSRFPFDVLVKSAEATLEQSVEAVVGAA